MLNAPLEQPEAMIGVTAQCLAASVAANWWTCLTRWLTTQYIPWWLPLPQGDQNSWVMVLKLLLLPSMSGWRWVWQVYIDALKGPTARWITLFSSLSTVELDLWSVQGFFKREARLPTYLTGLATPLAG